MLTIVDAFRAAFDTQNLASACHRLTEPQINVSKVQDHMREWSQNFQLPALTDGEMRPYLLAHQGEHLVAVHLREAYDPVYYFRSKEPSIAQLVSGLKFDYPQILTQYGGNSEAAAVSEILKRVTTHLLYGDSVALEYPYFDFAFRDSSSVLKFARFCSNFETLIDAGLLHITPSRERIPRGVQTRSDDRSRELRSLRERLGVEGNDYSAWLASKNDPLGDLKPPYTEALANFPYEVDEDFMRARRLETHLGDILDGLESATRIPNVDLFATRSEVPLLKRMIDHSRLMPPDLDAVLAYNSLIDLKVPVGTIGTDDLVSIRQSGEFDAFRSGLRRGLLRADAVPADFWIDDRAMRIREIHDELEEFRASVSESVNKSKFLSTYFRQSVDLSVATVSGAVGSFAASPTLGAAIGVGTYVASLLVDWGKAKSTGPNEYFQRHLAVFDPPS